MINLVATANKLEKDRLDKLRNLSPKEVEDYIESLVLEIFKGFSGGDIDNDIDTSAAADNLDEFKRILNNDTSINNADAVILDRKMRYFKTAYESAFLNLENFKLKTYDVIKFTMDMSKLEILLISLKEILRVYYKNYSNYGRMEDLLFDMDDDGLAVDSDIREKYVYSKKYGINKSLMNYLDVLIEVKVEIIMDELDKLDKKYLMDDDFADAINGLVDGIHETITGIYENGSDFEIEVAKQTGLIDALFTSITDFKENAVRYNDEYLKIKNELLDLVNGNGFADLSAESYESYKKRYGDADFDDFMLKEPKYDVRNAKFIYPENREYHEF